MALGCADMLKGGCRHSPPGLWGCPAGPVFPRSGPTSGLSELCRWPGVLGHAWRRGHSTPWRKPYCRGHIYKQTQTECVHTQIDTHLIIHIIMYCSGIYFEDRDAKKGEKNPIMKSHQVWLELVYPWENRGISEHLISFSPVQEVHLRLESCLWERPVICVAVHMSVTTQFHLHANKTSSKENFILKMLSWHWSCLPAWYKTFQCMNILIGIYFFLKLFIH